MAEYRVAIVIPAFNEEDTIAQVVNSVKSYGCPIVVNDASTDNTERLAAQAGAIVISNKTNQGYDQTLNSGFIEADRRNFDAVITFDADGQHSPEMLKEYIENLEKGVDLVLGVRPKPARIAEWIFMIYTRIRFNWKDPLCGMKGYSIRTYQKQGYFDSYNSIGTELAIFCLLNKYSYVQLIVPIAERQDKPRFFSIIKANLYILLALFKVIKRKRLAE